MGYINAESVEKNLVLLQSQCLLTATFHWVNGYMQYFISYQIKKE